MIIKNFSVDFFRNIENLNLNPCEGINIIYGDNGQGKTNIIEGIWLCTGFKSFRTKKNSDFIPHGKDIYKFSMDFFSENRDKNIRFQSDIKKQEVYENEVKMVSTRSIIGDFTSIVFSPAHLSLIKEGPEEKRKFLDIAISQLKPNYARLLSQYMKNLKQRNALLKMFDNSEYEYDLLDCWDENLSETGGKIISERLKYIDLLSENSVEIYQGISGGKEKIEIEYLQVGREKKSEEKEIIQSLYESFKKSRENDIKNKFTSKGPHRDDFDIKIDGKNAKSFASQGQQRSATLALKLGEASIIEKINNEKPVALLDDVMSELDVGRQDYILNKLKNWQVFITCCEPTQVLRMNGGKSFKIEKGKIIE